jgi:hypothetical protein
MPMESFIEGMRNRSESKEYYIGKESKNKPSYPQGKFMKKISLFVSLALLALVSVSLAVNAQTAAPSIIVRPAPPEPVVPIVSSGFVQFNNLTVESVSSGNVPAEIVATAPVIFSPAPMPMPLSGGASGASGSSGSGSGTTGSGSVGSGTITPSILCYKFNSQNDANGFAYPCPVPPQPPQPEPTPSAISYRIEVNSQTGLMLRDRTPATLANFTVGDQINVFGYYNTDGSIQAYLVRDTSKPLENQTLQLNNVTLNSLSGTSIPATLTVVQAQGAPCLGFNGGQKAIACPMGVSSFSNNSATTNASPLPSLAPNWMMLRKYVVTVDAQTIILDRNRTQLSLSSLNPGDTLNVYGDTNDNGQTISANIIRDLSIPAMASTYTGTVTQVNADGSFVIQTSGGKSLIVQSPITVGQTVTIQGLADASSGVISQVSQIMIGNTIQSPTPVSTPPGLPMLRINGGTYPTSTNGHPINY